MGTSRSRSTRTGPVIAGRRHRRPTAAAASRAPRESGTPSSEGTGSNWDTSAPGPDGGGDFRTLASDPDDPRAHPVSEEWLAAHVAQRLVELNAGDDRHRRFSAAPGM